MAAKLGSVLQVSEVTRLNCLEFGEEVFDQVAPLVDVLVDLAQRVVVGRGHPANPGKDV